MAVNKKIKNATPTTYNGIEFKSKKEKDFYVKLVACGYKPEYEVDSFILWNGFYPKHPWYLDGEPQIKKDRKPKKLLSWKYTPDFKIKVGKHTVYIEAKGRGNDLLSYKRKLFIDIIDMMDNVVYFEVYTVKGLMKTIQMMEKLKLEK